MLMMPPANSSFVVGVYVVGVSVKMCFMLLYQWCYVF